MGSVYKTLYLVSGVLTQDVVAKANEIWEWGWSLAMVNYIAYSQT